MPICGNWISKFRLLADWYLRYPVLMLSLGVATRWQCFRTLLCLEVRCESVAEGHGWQVGSSDAVFIIKKV